MIGDRERQPGHRTAPVMDDAQLQALAVLPLAQSCRLVDFERAEIITLESSPPQFVLRVSGTKPYLNMRVSLTPRTYIRPPEYWGIEVVGCVRGIGVPVRRPYSVRLRLTDIRGTKGVEVIGASRTKQLAVPPQDVPQGECREWNAWLDRQPPDPPTLHVTGVCEFPTEGFRVELRRHEPQGINPRVLLLDKIVYSPTDPVPQVVTPVRVRYQEKASAGFDTVTILPDGITIPVQEVS